SVVVCVVNFAALPHEDYRIGLPGAGTWLEIINTDASAYGGSGVGNLGQVHADDTPYAGWPASVALRVPPLGAPLPRPPRPAPPPRPPRPPPPPAPPPPPPPRPPPPPPLPPPAFPADQGVVAPHFGHNGPTTP